MGAMGVIRHRLPMAEERDTNGFSLSVDGNDYTASALSMGNPHCVLFVPDAEKAPLTQLGPRIETLPFFPKRTNVEFAQVLDKTRIRMRVWERGVA